MTDEIAQPTGKPTFGTVAETELDYSTNSRWLWLAAFAAFIAAFAVAESRFRAHRRPPSDPPVELAKSDIEVNDQAVKGFLKFSKVSDSPLQEKASLQEETQPRAPLQPDELFRRISPAVVQVVVQDAEGRRAGSGTGFLVSKNGLIATNYHVIENAHSAFIILADETRLAVSGVAARDEKADIAILSVPYKVVSEPIELSTIEAPIGSKVYAIGNPLGLSNSLSDGIVSGYRESEGIRVIQTTAPISPGSSGGPLLSADGRVIGVTTFVFKGGQNLNFAVTNFHLKQQILKSNDRIEDAHFPLRNSSFAHEPRSNESTSPKRDSNEIDVTLDNPSSLISTEPKSIVVKGIRLGMTRQEVAKVLSTSEELMGVEDENNLSRVYVYHRNSDGSRGDAVLYLIWEPAETKMNRITVFQAYRGSLSKTFKRLLSFEAVDDKSSFKRDFVGYANRQKVTLNIPEIGLKHVTYYYDDLGLEITHKHGSRGDEVIFAIVQKAR